MFICLSGTPKSMIAGLSLVCKRHVYQPFRKIFPDGEQYLRFDTNLKGVELSVVQSFYPEQDRKIVELYLALEALTGLGAKPKNVIALYVAYARQDKRFLSGEPISVKALYQGLRLYSVERFITVDVHSPQIFIDIGLDTVNIIPHGFMIEQLGLKIDIVLAPDKGALQRALNVANKFNVTYDYLDKFRDRVTGEITIDSKALDVKGKNVVIVDDIISTGKTIAKAAEVLYKAGANNVYAVVTHALLSRESLDILSKAGLSRLVISNTIEQQLDLPSWITVIDLSPILCNVL